MTRLNAGTDLLPRSGGGKRYFTLAEANRALVLVKRIIADVVTEYARLLDLLEAVEAAEADADAAEEYLDRAHKELAQTSFRLRTCLEELDDVGVELIDWSSGSVAFPSVAGGREVDLCWQHGEPKILYWREGYSPHAGRRPIEALLAEMAATLATR